MSRVMAALLIRMSSLPNRQDLLESGFDLGGVGDVHGDGEGFAARLQFRRRGSGFSVLQAATATWRRTRPARPQWRGQFL